MRWDADGNPLCRWCSKIVIPPKKTFCSKECVHEWKIRSNITYLRKVIVKRDKGICALCKINCLQICRGFKRPLRGETREQWKRRVAATRRKYGIPKHRMTAYDVDHIVPVVEGGGAGIKDLLSNLRILCLKCHKKVTAKLAAKRAKEKKSNHT